MIRGRQESDRALSMGGPEWRSGGLLNTSAGGRTLRRSAEALSPEVQRLHFHPDLQQMLGRSAEALCLEVRRPQKPTGTMAHRKAFSLDYGSRQQGHPAERWGRFSPGVNVDVLRPEDPSASSSDSGMISPVPASRFQDGSFVNRGIASSNLDLGDGGSFLNNAGRPLTPSSSDQEVEVEDLSRSPSGLAPSGYNLALAGTSLAPSGSSLAPSGSSLALASPTGEQRISKRERNRVKSVRRRQRRRERWRQREIQDNVQSSTGNPSSSSDDDDDEERSGRDREGCICAVCLDVYFCPYMCHPCNHVFCEPCLRTLAKNCPTNTPCPLCRTTITHVFFQKELNQTARTFFPKEYLSRKQNFQKASCAKWPLPSCRKLFRIFGGFQRQSSPIARRQFPHGGYRLDALDFEDDSRGWRFDMDMVIIYIYSVNWVIGFIIFIFLCYCFFPSL
ncbi:E3 ubiquitin-protein ligase RNF180 [Colossoma macropomum]|uniref:E3 ubiquitin-protein ligase RNF180 n=1 Tax=Colossoma macropomum TaxID=42526 RepID=UPI001864AD04|nr:E3 ubiquitin-protein ligase RNF180 [Colossoma macropomum]